MPTLGVYVRRLSGARADSLSLVITESESIAGGITRLLLLGVIVVIIGAALGVIGLVVLLSTASAEQTTISLPHPRPVTTLYRCIATDDGAERLPQHAHA